MIKQIQNEYTPDVVTPPGDTLQEVIDTTGMTKAELADRIGKTPKFINDIINHYAAITPTTAMELEKVLGTPASFWNNRERRYRESIARQNERKRLQKEIQWLDDFPISPMVKAGWIEKHKNKINQVDALLRFFGIASSRQWEKLWLSPATVYRKSNAFAAKPEACSVWLRKGELQAQERICETFDKEKFKSALTTIRHLTRSEPQQFESKTIQLCAESGVAVVFTPSIKGAPVYGATRWLTPEKAMIQLSLRGKFEDLLWFTFFHESGHILLHGKKEVFIEDNDGRTEKEKEADCFAANFLIPINAWQKFFSTANYQSKAAVEDFAKEQQISPAIVVGRLQHDNLIPHNRLNDLRRRFEIKRSS
ncbi:MAG: helix-turn-helix domain-containing protein [Desulfobacterales bacterium]|nr:helix-turn-helix domain-containing protein [Desulfobacterales bacterium]